MSLEASVEMHGEDLVEVRTRERLGESCPHLVA
jgi:hypothetical protein